MRRILDIGLATFLTFAGTSGAAAMTITCEKPAGGVPSVSMTGSIEGAQTPRKEFVDAVNLRTEFDKCFRGYAGMRQIRLHSGGGSVDSSLAMSEFLIGQENVATSVIASVVDAKGVRKPGHCISACTYLFVAGASRDVPAGASFEPHGFSSWRNYTSPFLRFVCHGTLARPPTKDFAALYERAQVAWIQSDFCDSWWGYIGALRKAVSNSELPADDLLEFIITTPTEGKSDLSPLGAQLAEIQRQALTPPRRKLLKSMRDTLASALSELQREMALHAYGQARIGRPTAAAYFDQLAVKYGRDWIAVGFDRAIRQFHADVQDRVTRGAETWNVAGELIGGLVRTVGTDADETMRTQLMSYLANRRNNQREMGLDDDKLMSLMFSTSIIYMRPLSRDELCDLNVVTRGCD